MEASQLATLIEAYVAALAASGGQGAHVSRLAKALRKGGSQSFAKILSALEKDMFQDIPAIGPTLGDLVLPVAKLSALLTEAGAKKTVVADLELLLDLLRRRSEVSLTVFESCEFGSVASASRRRADPGAPPVDTKQLIENYLQRLEAALGNDGLFRAVFNELSADRNITKVEAIEIASRFFEPLAQSATRPKALRKILYRHEKLLDARSGAKSIGGQAA